MSYEHDAPPKAAYATPEAVGRQFALTNPKAAAFLVVEAIRLLHVPISEANHEHFADQVVDRIARGT